MTEATDNVNIYNARALAPRYHTDGARAGYTGKPYAIFPSAKLNI